MVIWLICQNKTDLISDFRPAQMGTEKAKIYHKNKNHNLVEKLCNSDLTGRVGMRVEKLSNRSPLSEELERVRGERERRWNHLTLFLY